MTTIQSICDDLKIPFYKKYVLGNEYFNPKYQIKIYVGNNVVAIRYVEIEKEVFGIFYSKEATPNIKKVLTEQIKTELRSRHIIS